MKRALLLFLISLNSLAFNLESLKNDLDKAPKKYDWILLTSNEVVKGEVITLYQEDMEFDSDELDLLEIDWKEVSILKTVGPMSIRLNDGTIAKGRLVITSNEIRVITDSKIKIFERSELNTIARTSEKEVELWDGEFTFGFDFRDGNTERLDFLASTDLRRLTASSRININYLTQFSTASGEETDNNHRLNSTFDLFYSQSIFIRLADFEFFKDKFQNLKSRITLGVSLGYIILDNKKHEWDISIGPSFQQTTYIDVAEGSKLKETSPVIQFNTDYEYEVTKDIDFEFSYRIQVVNKESGQLLQNIKGGFEVELIDDFDIDILALLDRVEKPTSTSEGNVPQKNDYTLSFGISYEF